MKDQLTFKSKRYRDDRGIKLEFYINDLLEEQMTACCEYALVNMHQGNLFQIQHVFGTKPCQK